MAILEIKVPDIGDFDEVAVIELLVQPGDAVRAEQSLLTVESDKASMEIPSSHAGVVRALKVALGDKVRQGSPVLLLEVAQAAGVDSDQNQPPTLAEPALNAIDEEALVAQPALTDGSEASETPEAPETLVLQESAALDFEAAQPVEVRVPDIGDFQDVTVIEVMVAVGDTVRQEQSLVTVESDKASMEIPSSHAGVVQALKVKLGDTVNRGDLLLMLQAPVLPGASASWPGGQDAIENSAPALVNQALTATGSEPVPAPGPVPGPAVQPSHQPGAAPRGLPHASPSVRKLARELGVPLTEVTGSGPKGRITTDDVQAFTRAVMAAAVQTAAIASRESARVAQAVTALQAAQAVDAAAQPTAGAGYDGAALGLIPWPKVDFAKFGPIQRKELGRIQKISGANLLRNAVMIPAVTNHDDADITELEAFRVATNKENEKSGIKLTLLAFLVKACVAALKKFPDFNSSLDGDALVYKQYWHIGFAADTPNGLMVPVIKDADKKGILQISAEMAELAKKAREGKLSPADMSGATFTISSLGGIGGRYFTPIINAPEVAILGVCKNYTAPVWDGQQFVPRLMLPLSLTWDHRVIDGAAAARFNVCLGQMLGDMRRILL